MPTTHLLYLHGFRSSPQSAKARQVTAWMQAHHPEVVWWCPQLPPSPREAMELVSQGIAGGPRDTMAVMGSSLGGFYATQVAETCSCKAVLLNPAVNPARDLAKYIGEQTAWHDPNEHFFFEPGFVDELRLLAHGPLARPQDYFAVIAKGDEVLDWREMTGRYAGARIRLLEGGDHAISDFERHLPEVMDFLELA
ncbi:YqiA/YcfP family alpha/beta fold hydrolase [Polaromonas sp.]|uniref:YqiA/YcfP family alpha/beta fold hydrolase n=1 Tax=Polaromonas sp. TaxID=1869339 RepID=UPI002489B6E1|nr:YqiA/YcfP family alpha/beta fold hydrolase [Polaromonas sp.]MDI1275668.1 esterase [Polaromonas sp.]